LAIPSKRYDKHPIDFLHHDEAEALLNAPDQASWFGRRDRTLLLVMLQTGLRVTELIELCNNDVELGTGAHVRCLGKGRKSRATPLRKDSVQALTQWQGEHDCRPDMPLFPSNRGTALSRDAVERLVRKHARRAITDCPSIERKHVTPHVLRHTAAMQLRQSGVDLTIIALWLGHESVESTQIYVHADLQMKEKAMARTDPTDSKAARYRPDDQLLEFLEGL
jgi:site-specific recombinase XerD